MICPDRVSEANAVLHTSKDLKESNNPLDGSLRSFTVPYVIPSTFIGEHYFYTNILRDIIPLDEKGGNDWIGAIPWNTDTSLNVTNLDRFLSDNNIVNDTIEFIAFSNTERAVYYSKLASLNHSCCPGIEELVLYILENTGEAPSDISSFHPSSHAVKVMGQLGFMVRVRWMQPFILWLSRVILFVNTDPLAQQRVWKACKAQSNTTSPFVPLHPFLTQLLTSYFFHSRKLNAISVDVSSRLDNAHHSMHETSQIDQYVHEEIIDSIYV